MVLLAFVFVQFTYSQFLEVRRPASLKRSPRSDATVIEHVEKGTFLELLNGGKQDSGYYKVKTGQGNRIGWIYRTLVRRHEGSIPSASARSSSSTDRVFLIPIDDLKKWSEGITTTYDNVKITGHSGVHGQDEDC